MNRLEILLIEDNPDDRILLNEMLTDSAVRSYDDSDMQYSLTAAKSIEEALAILSGEAQVDVILLDLSLPDSKELDGLDKLGEYLYEIPVIILTGLADNRKAVEALRMGAQDYLIKGRITSDLIIRSIRYALERHKLITMLRGLSLIDDLTGLYNRRGFMTIAEEKLKAAKRDKKKLILFYIDLDNMKQINDKHGHTVGDKALRATAEVLRNSLRDSDVIARIGGDEFAALALSSKAEKARVIEERIDAKVKIFNDEGSVPVHLGLSIGHLVESDLETTPCSELLDRADAAMYRIKTGKKGTGTDH
ncbi:MAG: diguanylate cyclase [Spirochaetia bacterium]